MSESQEPEIQFDRNRHGGLYDRGRADSYYGRMASPHWYPAGTYMGPRVDQLTQAEIDEYMAGYGRNEADGDRKDWGRPPGPGITAVVIVERKP